MTGDVLFPARASPEDALRAWRGILDGTHRVVRRTDAEGRRLVVLRAVEPGGRAPLSARERRVVELASLGVSNKAIGFAVGVAPSTAAGILAGALRKLGVGSRREAIALFGAAAAVSAARAPSPGG